MKSARERAEALANTFVGTVQTRAWISLVEAAEASFKEHARDQRENCAAATGNGGAILAHAPGETG